MQIFNEIIDKGNNEVNCVIGGIAPALDQERERLATILLCNILGGPASNSVLGAILREKHGWVYNVECSYTAYSSSGIATIQFGCDRENLTKCRKVIRRELHRIQSSPLSERRLSAAKRQMLGQNAIGMESGEAQCLSMGKNLICFGLVYSDSEIEALVNDIPASLVQEMACRVFGDENLSTLVYL